MKKNSFFPTTEAGMCMKTNKTATICRPKMTTFLHDLADCSDISYQPSRILRELEPFFSRFERRRTQSWFQSAETQAPGFTGRGCIADACYEPRPAPSRHQSEMWKGNPWSAAGNHPPALMRRPLLNQEGSLWCESGGEPLGGTWIDPFIPGKCRWMPRCV